VTLVIANPEHRYPLACGGNPDRLGVRLIAGPLAGAMTPVLQTSANRAGAAPPANFEEVDPRILGEAHLAIDGGGLGGAPSTVVDIGGIDSGGEWTVLREGALSSAEIEAKLGV
jgi:L-threonylcarbamoyladenylate synthase